MTERGNITEYFTAREEIGIPPPVLQSKTAFRLPLCSHDFADV
jgi:hypothetical protein